MKILSKRNIIIAVIVLAIAGYGYNRYRQANQPITYETAKVTRGLLVQTVEATGKIKSSNDLQLRFETAGTVGYVYVQENDRVKAGQVLVALHVPQLNAAVAQAQANLNQTIAGATDQVISQYEADVKKSEANLAKAQADLANFQAGLKQTYENAYVNQLTILQGAITPMETAMTDMDTVLGIENITANDTFEAAMTSLENSSFYASQARAVFNTARARLTEAKDASFVLTVASAPAEIDSATTKISAALDAIYNALASVWTVLDKLDVNAPRHNLTVSIVNTKRTTIDTDRAAVTTKKSAVLTGSQSIATANLNYTGEAGSAGASQVAQYEATVKIYEAALDASRAALAGKVAPQREVDLAPLRAALAQAAANREKAILRAPLDGIVAKVNKKVGELVSSTDVAVNFISPHFEIDVDIPETDVSKIKLNDATVITLDAFGDDAKFTGKVVSIEPASTEIQDVVYYKVKVALDDTDKAIKSGMTANVTVSTASRDNALYIPARAVRTNGEKYVRVLVGSEAKDMPVKLGLRADDGKVEIMAGLKEGDAVVLSIKTQ